MECLAQAGCLLYLTNHEGETALHVAAVRGNHNIVQFLVENGVNLDATDNVWSLPVHYVYICVSRDALLLGVHLLFVEWTFGSPPGNSEE